MSGNSRGTFSRERPIGSTCDGVFNYLSLLIAVIRSRLLMARDLTSVSISPTSRSRCTAGFAERASFGGTAADAILQHQEKLTFVKSIERPLAVPGHCSSPAISPANVSLLWPLLAFRPARSSRVREQAAISVDRKQSAPHADGATYSASPCALRARRRRPPILPHLDSGGSRLTPQSARRCGA